VISTHQELFTWLAPQLIDARRDLTVSAYFVEEAEALVEFIEDLGYYYPWDEGSFHTFLHYAIRHPPGITAACSKELLWFFTQVKAAAINGFCTLEVANQIAIDALGLDLHHVKIREREIRSTERCRSDLGVEIRVALKQEPYVLISL
jgi:hypothetical protein